MHLSGKTGEETVFTVSAENAKFRRERISLYLIIVGHVLGGAVASFAFWNIPNMSWTVFSVVQIPSLCLYLPMALQRGYWRLGMNGIETVPQNGQGQRIEWCDVSSVYWSRSDLRFYSLETRITLPLRNLPTAEREKIREFIKKQLGKSFDLCDSAEPQSWANFAKLCAVATMLTGWIFGPWAILASSQNESLHSAGGLWITVSIISLIPWFIALFRKNSPWRSRDSKGKDEPTVDSYL